MLSKPYAGQGSDSLVDCTSEVLEREGVDEGVICRGRVRLWARLEDRTHS